MPDHSPGQTDKTIGAKHDLQIGRRTFLKLASLLSITPVLDRICKLAPSQGQDKANVIIILFDTLSTRHLSLYGYHRETTPNLTRFAERATVYHSHYTSGNFTVPATASLLTGTYPWTHRAFNSAGKVTQAYRKRNIFSLFGNQYNRIAYPHNMWAHLLLNQFCEDIDVYLDPKSFSLFDDMFYSRLLSGDVDISVRSFEEVLLPNDQLPGSLFLSLLNEIKSIGDLKANIKKLGSAYPRGIPCLSQYKAYFLVEDVIGGVQDVFNEARQPLLAYLHFFPPHEPYRPRSEFVDIFRDGWKAVTKEQHFFSEGHSEEYLNQQRTWYDEYITHTDAEFGRLYDALKEKDLAHNSYIIFTSDHGELFERGVHGHCTPLIYDPIIHVPLLISQPGQQQREDVYTPTNCVDLLPTLLQVTDQPIPDWCEGKILPGLGGVEDSERRVFSMEAKSNPAHMPLRKGTLALIKDRYELVHYFGYPGYEDEYELYDLENDPEELYNLYPSRKSLAGDMQRQLEEKLREVNRPYL